MIVKKEPVKKGAIEEMEMEAFKHRTKPGQTLRCYKPKRQSEDKYALQNMQVVKTYPFLVLLSYRSEAGKICRTSMPWSEAVILNRLTQAELTEEITKMQKEKGLPFYQSPVYERPKMSRRQRADLIIRLRDLGRTYVDIAKTVGLHSSSVRIIYQKETEAKCKA